MTRDHGCETSRGGDARLIIAVTVNCLLTAGQIIGGLLSGSLGLIADALHNLQDAASLGLALLARRIARKPADQLLTFGYCRAELIGALINLTALIVVGLYLIFEAVWRLFEERHVGGWTVIAVATLALVVDAITAVLTYSMSKGSLNMKAAFIHNLADALASVGVIIAGILVLLYDWIWADAAAALLVSLYIIAQGATAMRSTIRILMDSVPVGVSLTEVASMMERVEHVHGVHHLHIRNLDEQHRALEAHVVMDDTSPSRLEVTKRAIKAALREQFHIDHSTLEFESPSVEPHATDMIVQH